MAEFDTITKELIHTWPRDFARFALRRDDLDVLDVLDTEQPTVEARRADSLIRVRIEDEEALVHYEFQTADSDPPMPRRMAGYLGRAVVCSARRRRLWPKRARSITWRSLRF